MSRIKYMAIILMLAATMSLSSCGSDETKEVLLQTNLLQTEIQNAQNPNYKTVTVRKGEYVKSKNGSAAVAYLLEKDLVWENGNARYEDILVTRGQEVKKGDVLAVFEIEENKTQMEELQIQLKRTKEDFEKEKSKRLEAIEEAEIYAIYHYNYEELDVAKLKIEMQKADYAQYVFRTMQQIESLEERISDLKKDFSENTLKAPFDGIVHYVTTYHPGDQVEAGSVIIGMYSTDNIVLITEDVTDNLRYNMDVTITASYKKEKKVFEGTVVSDPKVLTDDVSQKYTVIQLKEPVSVIDLQGEVSYKCDTEVLKEVLLIDRDAVTKEDNKDFVYILEDGSVKKRFIVTGPFNMDEIVVFDGLKEGQTLVID